MVLESGTLANRSLLAVRPKTDGLTLYLEIADDSVLETERSPEEIVDVGGVLKMVSCESGEEREERRGPGGRE